MCSILSTSYTLYLGRKTQSEGGKRGAIWPVEKREIIHQSEKSKIHVTSFSSDSSEEELGYPPS